MSKQTKGESPDLLGESLVKQKVLLEQQLLEGKKKLAEEYLLMPPNKRLEKSVRLNKEKLLLEENQKDIEKDNLEALRFLESEIESHKTKIENVNVWLENMIKDRDYAKERFISEMKLVSEKNEKIIKNGQTRYKKCYEEYSSVQEFEKIKEKMEKEHFELLSLGVQADNEAKAKIHNMETIYMAEKIKNQVEMNEKIQEIFTFMSSLSYRQAENTKNRALEENRKGKLTLIRAAEKEKELLLLNEKLLIEQKKLARENDILAGLTRKIWKNLATTTRQRNEILDSLIDVSSLDNISFL